MEGAWTEGKGALTKVQDGVAIVVSGLDICPGLDQHLEGLSVTVLGG